MNVTNIVFISLENNFYQNPRFTKMTPNLKNSKWCIVYIHKDVKVSLGFVPSPPLRKHLRIWNLHWPCQSGIVNPLWIYIVI